MPRRPWYPMNPSDYLADTKLLSLEAHGLYMLLLHYHWIEEVLPNCPRLLAKLTGQDPRRFRRCFKEIQEFFEESNGNLINRRMVAEIEEAKKRRQKGEFAAGARWGTPAEKSEVEHPPSTCQTDASTTTTTTTYSPSPPDDSSTKDSHPGKSPPTKPATGPLAPPGPDPVWATEWASWLASWEGRMNKRFDPVQAELQLMDLLSKDPAKALADLKMSIDRYAKRILDSDNDFDKKFSKRKNDEDYGF